MLKRAVVVIYTKTCYIIFYIHSTCLLLPTNPIKRHHQRIDPRCYYLIVVQKLLQTFMSHTDELKHTCPFIIMNIYFELFHINHPDTGNTH